MKKLLLLFLFPVLLFGAPGTVITPTVLPTRAAAGVREVWLAVRPDGKTGLGTKADPWNAGADLSVFWPTVEAVSPTVVQFVKGETPFVTTRSIRLINGATFVGNGATIQAATTFWRPGGRQGTGGPVGSPPPGSLLYGCLFGGADDQLPDNNTGLTNVTVTGFVFDCNNQNQTTPYAAIGAVNMVGQGNRVLNNKFINWGSRNFWGNDSGYTGIETFVVALGAPWSGGSDYPSGCEMAYNEFTQPAGTTLYTSLLTDAGFVYDAAYAANLANYMHGTRIHHNWIHDIEYVEKVISNITIGAGATFTSAGHGLYDGEPVAIVTSGALPTGLSSFPTVYYVKTPTTDTFRLAATQGGASITTSGTQSGEHKWQMIGQLNGMGSTWSIGAVMEHNLFTRANVIGVYRDTGHTIDETIRNNTFEDVQFGIYLVPSLFPVGVTNNNVNTTIENNTVAARVIQPGLFFGIGIAIQNGSNWETNAFTNPTIRGNRIRRYGTTGQVVGLQVASSTGGVVENNYVSTEVGSAAGDHARIYHNINLTVKNNTVRQQVDLLGNTGLKLSGSRDYNGVRLDPRADATELSTGHKVAVPASATAACEVPDWASDGSYIYWCVSTNVWRRAAGATW